MRTASSSATEIDSAEFPGMLATLCSYENRFGPYHPQTLHLMAHVGIAFWQAGDLRHARPLLERVVRDSGRHLGADHQLRLRAIAALRDLFFAQRDYTRAASAQKNILESQIRRLGATHPETLATRADLVAILMETAVREPVKNCTAVS
jgi:Tetratricopeptide repeat